MHQGSPRLQLGLDRAPELGSDDRWMLAWVDLAAVPDAPSVERIGQQAVEVPAAERVVSKNTNELKTLASPWPGRKHRH